MKIVPRKYALALMSAMEESADPAVIQNFLKLLWRRRCFKLLPKIFKIFEEEWNKRTGIIKLNIWYPAKFEGALKEFRMNLEKSSAKKIEMNVSADSSLIGGYKIHCDDVLLDASVSGQLKRLKEKLYS